MCSWWWCWQRKLYVALDGDENHDDHDGGDDDDDGDHHDDHHDHDGDRDDHDDRTDNGYEDGGSAISKTTELRLWIATRLQPNNN